MYDSRFKRDFKGKMHIRWLGLYQIDKVFDNGTICLVAIDEDQKPLFTNVHRLQLYYKSISKDAFISHVAADPDYLLVQGKEFFLLL